MGRDSKLSNGFVAVAIVVVGMACAPFTHAQTNAASDQGTERRQSGVDIHRDGWDRIVPQPPKQTGAPAPVRDLTGIWEPIPAYRDGVFALGPKGNPADANHLLPFTPLGLQMFTGQEAGKGTPSFLIVNGRTIPVVSTEKNGPPIPTVTREDPFDICDPIGFPRIELFNLRAIQIYENKNQMAIIYQNDQVWRNIWMDGRELPKVDDVPESRWYGYSVGHWTDDYTFVVETVGLDERTWIDNVARPHSDQLKVTETWHRVDHDVMELTLIVDDPKMYSKPWTALDKFRMGLQPEWFDIREQVCAVSEDLDYTKIVANPADPKKKSDTPEK
jgi:hypothetical protein